MDTMVRTCKMFRLKRRLSFSQYTKRPSMLHLLWETGLYLRSPALEIQLPSVQLKPQSVSPDPPQGKGKRREKEQSCFGSAGDREFGPPSSLPGTASDGACATDVTPLEQSMTYWDIHPILSSAYIWLCATSTWGKILNHLCPPTRLSA